MGSDGMRKIYESPERIHEIIMLRDIYESLLPPRQRQVAYLKFDEDLSLSEIAQRLGISKQGCDDAVRRCVKALLSYEDKLVSENGWHTLSKRWNLRRALMNTIGGR